MSWISSLSAFSIRIAAPGRGDARPHVESKMLRRVQLSVPGSLYLHSMPGRHEPFAEAVQEIARCGITHVVCLAAVEEVRRKSPDYAEALDVGVAWKHDALPIPDFGVPVDVSAFWAHAEDTARALGDGERILVHCGAGIGRTGMYAVAVVRKLGQSLADATKLIRDAGSGAETPEQRALLSALAG